MTREKKEILKKIEEIEFHIGVDKEFGCGFAPVGAYDEAYKEIDRLYEKLAHLRHYNSAGEMMYDERGYSFDPEIPFCY